MNDDDQDWATVNPAGERLERIARALAVPVAVFYRNVEVAQPSTNPRNDDEMTAELVAAFKMIGSSMMRHRVLSLVKCLADENQL